jgi:hypothetical protein
MLFEPKRDDGIDALLVLVSDRRVHTLSAKFYR